MQKFRLGGEEIEIEGVKSGKTSIVISATGAENKIVGVSVESNDDGQLKIDLSVNSFNAYSDEEWLYSEIKNFDQLKNLKIEKIDQESDNSKYDVVNAEINKETKHVEIRIRSHGKAKVYLRGEKTKTCVIDIVIKALETIEFDIPRDERGWQIVYLFKKQTASFNIQESSGFLNLRDGWLMGGIGAEVFTEILAFPWRGQITSKGQIDVGTIVFYVKHFVSSSMHYWIL